MGQRRDQVGRQEGQDRPATEQELRELNVTIARTMNAGYTRVMGELEKVGIKPPSRNTVKRVCFRLGTSQIADSISPRVYMGGSDDCGVDKRKAIEAEAGTFSRELP